MKFVEEYVPTIVIDNFFETPSLVINLAKQQKYWRCYDHPNKGNWPGKRSELLDSVDPVLHEIICRKVTSYLPAFVGFDIADIAFHVCDGNNKRGWIHSDPPHLGVGMVIYLNDGVVPNRGTTIYDVPPNFSGQGFEEEFKKQLLAQDDEESAAAYEKYKDECNSMYQTSISIESRYNRCLIFDGRKFHGGMDFYGNDVNDARLTIVGFFHGITHDLVNI